MNFKVLLTGLLCTASMAGPTLAQDSALPQGSACEIHVWAGTEYEAGSTGWADSLGGGVLGAAMDAAGHIDRKLTTQEVFQQKLGSERQQTIMRTFDYSRFIRSDAIAVVENSPFEQKAISKKMERGTGSVNPCYIEIYVLKNRYYYAPLPGKQFQTTFLIKDFRPSGKPRVFRDMKITKIKIFPALEPSQQDLAVQELEQAFHNNLNNFAVRVFGESSGGAPGGTR